MAKFTLAQVNAWVVATTSKVLLKIYDKITTTDGEHIAVTDSDNKAVMDELKVQGLHALGKYGSDIIRSTGIATSTPANIVYDAIQCVGNVGVVFTAITDDARVSCALNGVSSIDVPGTVVLTSAGYELLPGVVLRGEFKNITITQGTLMCYRNVAVV